MHYPDANATYAGNGSLYINESPPHGEPFVSPKITKAAPRIKLRLQDKLFLGNLDAKRDWGYAGDYMEAIWLMMQQAKPDDYVIATGQTHSVRDFLDEAFAYLDLDWHRHVDIDERYYRATEVDLLLGDATKAKKKIGWEPRVQFKELVRMMVDSDLKIESTRANETSAVPHHELLDK